MEQPARRRKRKLPLWSHRPAYYGVRLAASLANIAGPEPAMRIMRQAGGAWAGLPMNRRRLHRAMENIAWCFPMWDRELVHEYAIESYRHLFCLVTELVLTPRLLTEDGFPSHVEIGDMREGLKALVAERPCILITGHCGNWELLGYSMAMLGFPMHALYRPLDMTHLNNWMRETRGRRGLTLVDKFGAADLLPRLVERREPVGFIADQNAGERGLFVPFFNRLASTYKTIGLLAMRFGATILCGHARRLSGLSAELGPERSAALHRAGGRGRHAVHAPSQEARESQRFRYHLDMVDHFGPDDWKSHPDPLFYITARYRRAIETMVRRAPEQNLWMHRYWKSRPPHERKGRPFPAQLREKIAALPWMDDDDVRQIVERSARDARALHHHR